ncbi:aminotransferase-like domain-containing protein [Brachymonas denitrificans]|jgi:2-aminoadipate transaminase|uniref:2-aminoadipate transaminase n=1 Tax=Brachymonas denitrificans DSM 15123 TaxID=1121117 RepID=A0A1H8KSE1_9BURK|nr:PLP-dependent aminotransferase family protein [Brachymonas denitrificans]SEN95820.1 2-aminoadipate transaminase [Brachymonas denitrificans DSM 15123]
MKSWQFATRAAAMSPSIIREILKVTEQPDIISFAGGLPSPDSFPIEAFSAAYEKVMREHPRSALQYAASEGYAPLREWVAQSLPWDVSPDQVLITTGSQQGLDLVGKVLIDEGSRVVVQTPSYLGALQAFSAYEPEIFSVPNDDQGVQLESLEREQLRYQARFIYLLSNFQNPTGMTLSLHRRQEIAKTCHALGLPIVEDNPYGELWFDAPPPPPVASFYPEQSIYLGSFSKVLAPGMRLGFAVVPPEVYPKMLQAKQAADLHSPSLNQRLAYEVLTQPGFLEAHLERIRALYKGQCQAMLAALQRHMPDGVSWNTPKGGMFLWLRLPAGLDSAAMLPLAVQQGVAYVPGAAFYDTQPDMRTMRLSFVTATPDEIDRGIALLAQTIEQQLAA